MGAVCIYFGVPYCTDRIHYVLVEPEEQTTWTSSTYCKNLTFMYTYTFFHSRAEVVFSIHRYFI